jgi:hypothetical protein
MIRTTLLAALAAASLSGCIMVSKHTEPKPAPMAPAAPPVGAPAAAPAAPSGPAPLAIANPNYVTIPMETLVNKSAKDVWARIGKYCDIAEWLQIATGCKMISGKEGEIGSVRTVGNEVLVGKTELSYTYTQPTREGRPYNLYHGTLEVRPVTATTSRIVYTLMYDNSFIPGDAAAKAAEIERRRVTFTRANNNMKIWAEGGALPPPPPAAPAAPAPKPQ